LTLFRFLGGNGVNLTGRTKIYTHFREITPENVARVVAETAPIHLKNQGEINYLWMYYRGYQDILGRQKTVRPEICNNVVVNRANEIVSFKSSYFLGQPVQYIGRSNADANEINRLNDAMYSEDKNSKDKEIVDWMHICGAAYRMALPDQSGEEDGSPANILTLDPRYTYAIYSRDKGNPLIGAVLVRKNEQDQEVYEVYTNDWYFDVNGNRAEARANTLGAIPIVEYVNNEARIGAFEVVLPILNALNVLESNRTDSVEDFVNAFDVFQNCEIDAETYKGLTSGGMAINIKNNVPGMESKVYRITSELNQAGVQTAIDDLYDAVLSICGMPNRNGGSSTSDTGQAVLYRDGWSDAESRAKDTEALFKRSERQFLRVFLKICNGVTADKQKKLNLTINQIDIKCPRRNAANMQSKVQSFSGLLTTGYVAPEDAFVTSDIFPDPVAACARGLAWKQQQDEELSRSLQEELNAEREQVQPGRQGNITSEQESGTEVSIGAEQSKSA
jgi:SPP1 family phage portal protein